MFTKESIKMVTDVLPNGSYSVYMGGSLVIRGIRETTSDIDLVVTPSIFKSMSDGYSITKSVLGSNKFDITTPNGDIEVFEENNFDVELIEGVS